MPRIESPRGALAGAVRALVAAVEDEGVISDWEFAADAPARVDWVANEQATGWGDRPLQDAYRTGAILWYVVADQALSVADLLDSGRTLGLLSASRSLAESAARAGMLLRTETEPAARIRLMINERLYALHEDWRFSRDVAGLDSSWQMVTANRLIDVAETEFTMPVERPNDRRSGWVGQKRQPTMALLGDLINNQLLAAMFYRNTSAVSHAALHGLTKRLELRQDGDDAYRARLRTVSVAEATAEIAAALVALAIVARAVLTQAGWASRQFDVADAAFQSIIQTLIA